MDKKRFSISVPTELDAGIKKLKEEQCPDGSSNEMLTRLIQRGLEETEEQDKTKNR